MQLRKPLEVGNHTAMNSIHSGTPLPEIAVNMGKCFRNYSLFNILASWALYDIYKSVSNSDSQCKKGLTSRLD